MFHKGFGAGCEKTPETTPPSARHREKHRFRVWVSVALVAASVGTAANAAEIGDGVSGKQIPSGGYGVTSSRQCTGPGTAAVTNNTHGTIQVVSGAGAFAGISATNKKVRVSPGESMDGTVELSVVNHGPGFAVAPLIWTPSWGDRASSWRLISASVSPGQETFATQISVQTPQTPGTYHVVFALQLEMNGANVASATNWARGQPVWGDGNDIAQFSVEQIDEAQKFGCTINSWLTQSGSDLIYVPSDAITVEVGQGDAAQSPGFTTFLKVPADVPWTPTGVQLQKGDEVTISATGIIETNLAGATSSPWGTPPDCSVAGPVRVPFVAPQLPCWSLLGRIGPSGEPFEVGDRIVFKAATAGELYLGVNDNFFGDNSGNWAVTITAPPSPQAPALAPFCFNGAYASYILRQGSIQGTLKVRIKNVDLDNKTYLLSEEFGGPFSRRGWSTIRAVSLGSEGYHPWWGPQNAEDLGLLRQGSLPPALGPVGSVRRNLIATVPAGTFLTDVVSSGPMSIWFDVVSGLPVKLAGGSAFGFLGFPPPTPPVGIPYHPPARIYFELTGTNIPTSCFHCYSTNQDLKGIRKAKPSEGRLAEKQK